MDPTEDDAEETGPRREDDPDPMVRAGGPFGGGMGEGEFWTKAFDEAGTPNAPPGDDPPAQ